MTRHLRALNASFVIWAAIVLFLLVNVALTLLHVPFAEFDSDELQHLHIAWMVGNGSILYGDFWDHHGPVYSLFNGLIIYLTNSEPDIELGFYFRAISAVATGAILFVTYLIARTLSLSVKSAVTAVAILLSLIFVQDNGTELRPDPMQTLFWLSGLLLVLRNFTRQSSGVMMLAGALFGLAIVTNAKAGIGPFFVVLYYIFGVRLHHKSWQGVGGDLMSLAVGGFAVFLCVLGYFYSQGAVTEFLYLNYIWNIVLSLFWLGADTSDWLGSESPLRMVYLKFFLREQLPFVFLIFTGVVLLFSDLLSDSGKLDKPKGWFLLVVSIGTSFGWALNLYSQLYLMFLPLLAIIASFGLFRMVEGACQNSGARGGMVVTGAFMVLAVAMTSSAVNRTPLHESAGLKLQKEFTRRVLQVSDSADRFGVLWNTCGGYMFRDNAQYYWVFMPDINDIMDRISGENPFGATFVDVLENSNIKFIVGTDDWIFDRLPERSRAYIKANYSYDECLWTRTE